LIEFFVRKSITYERRAERDLPYAFVEERMTVKKGDA
jgi:hypothetical protein